MRNLKELGWNMIDHMMASGVTFEVWSKDYGIKHAAVDVKGKRVQFMNRLGNPTLVDSEDLEAMLLYLKESENK